MATNIISQEELKSLLHYDPETGVFTWKVSRSRKCEGDTAGRLSWNGYIQIGINNKLYLAHRLVWLYMYNKFPKQQIDHKNGVRTDNRLNNLREASPSENHQNRSKIEDTSSKYIGVSLHKPTRKWRAAIKIDYKVKHLGYFTTPELAYEAYLKAKSELHEFQPTPR